MRKYGGKVKKKLSRFHCFAPLVIDVNSPPATTTSTNQMHDLGKGRELRLGLVLYSIHLHDVCSRCLVELLVGHLWVSGPVKLLDGLRIYAAGHGVLLDKVSQTLKVCRAFVLGN